MLDPAAAKRNCAGMIHMLSYLLFLLLTCGYAVSRGGSDEWKGAAIMVVGSLLTLPAGSINQHWVGMQQGILAVDAGVLICFFLLAMLSDRFWPLWMTAFHLVGVLTHLAVYVNPHTVPIVYQTVQPMWAYPMLIALAMGARNYSMRQKKYPEESTSYH